MIGAPNSLNPNCKVHVTKEAPGPSVSEEIADIFTNYDIDVPGPIRVYMFKDRPSKRNDLERIAFVYNRLDTIKHIYNTSAMYWREFLLILFDNPLL